MGAILSGLWGTHVMYILEDQLFKVTLHIDLQNKISQVSFYSPYNTMFYSHIRMDIDWLSVR